MTDLPEGRKPLTAMDSADLVLRMHAKLAAGFTAGDRIAALEEIVEACKADAREAEAYAAELEAKLAKAMLVVEMIASADVDAVLGQAVDISCEIIGELMEEEEDE